MTNPQSQGDGLSACPFCGGAAHVWLQSRGSAVVGCCAGSHHCTVSPSVHAAEAEAIAAWNQRSTSPGVVVEDHSPLGAKKDAPSCGSPAGCQPSGGWLDIASAPRDGTSVLGLNASTGPVVVSFTGDGWRNERNEPRGIERWSPIPTPPQDQAREGVQSTSEPQQKDGADPIQDEGGKS